MIMRLRSRGIYSADVLRAMEAAPRKHFVSDDFWDRAYADRSLPISCGQSISAPLTIAMMTQALEVRADHKVLEIGTGSGYHAAILSRMCKRVYTVERYHQLLGEAEMRFRRLGINNIVTRHSDGRFGWKGQAPFDRILVTCGLKKVPNAILAQLAQGGAIVAVVKGKLMHITFDDVVPQEREILDLELPPVETGKSQLL